MFVHNDSPPAVIDSGTVAVAMRVHALRLTPGEDLRAALERFTAAQNVKAGFIVTAVGSLRCAVLRLADQSTASVFEQKYEIVSLAGTLSPDGAHLHIGLAGARGDTLGGHLLRGCEIYTTAEIVIGIADGCTFHREADETTGFKELVVRGHG